jgi:hypothetical protein
VEETFKTRMHVEIDFLHFQRRRMSPKTLPCVTHQAFVTLTDLFSNDRYFDKYRALRQERLDEVSKIEMPMRRDTSSKKINDEVCTEFIDLT